MGSLQAHMTYMWLLTCLSGYAMTNVWISD